MKSTWIAINAITAVAALLVTQAHSADPEIATPRPVNPLHGRQAGEVRDHDGLKMKLVWCPPGKFKMGSPKSEKERSDDEDQVDVTLTKGFWLGKYEVTEAEWKQVMDTEPWKGERLAKDGADFPATFVSWNDAVDFCRKMTEQERQAGRLTDEWEYTLPTAAQWERACRAGTKSRFSFGDDESQLRDYAWFLDSTFNGGDKHAHRVGQKRPNHWGLCDMHGNVWEWCRDVSGVKLPGGNDPEAKPDERTLVFYEIRELSRVIRGGGWNFGTAYCRSATRLRDPPWHRDPFIGFRVALTTVR